MVDGIEDCRPRVCVNDDGTVKEANVDKATSTDHPGCSTFAPVLRVRRQVPPTGVANNARHEGMEA
jgi:hypothetical protein